MSVEQVSSGFIWPLFTKTTQPQLKHKSVSRAIDDSPTQVNETICVLKPKTDYVLC